MFEEKFLDKKRSILFLSITLIFFGLLIYFQVCGAECSGSDPVGLVGSSANSSNGTADDNTLNGTATGCLISFSVLFIILGVALLVNRNCQVSFGKKLTENGFPMAAEIINGNKKNSPDSNELLLLQCNLIQKKVIDIAHIDPDTLTDSTFRQERKSQCQSQDQDDS